MAEQERLLFAIERSQHAPQRGGPGDARQNGVDVTFVVKQAGDSCSKLRENFRVNTGGPLIDDEQCHVILSQLTSDNAEGGLMRKMGAEKFVGFFDCDHQRSRLLALVAHRRLCQLDIFAMNFPGEYVGD